MKLSKILVTLTALSAITMTTLATPTSGDLLMVKDEATKLVLQMMPRGSEHISTRYDEDDKEYEVKVHNGGTKEKFEVKVDARLKAVEELDSETYVAAIQQIYNKLPKGSTFVGSKRVIEDQKVKYEMTFTYKAYHIEVTVDGSNGLTEDVEVFTVTEADKNAPNRYENGRYVAKYSPAQVEEIVLRHFPEGKVTEVQMSLSRNLWVYDVDVTLKNGTVDMLVCPETGAVVALDLDVKETEIPMIPVEPSTPVKPEQNKLLTEAQVRALVMKLVPTGRIVEMELDKEDGKWVYEVEVMDSKYEYSIEIDAKTGKTLDFDQEKLDDDDDYDNDDDHDDDDDDDRDND